MPGFSAMICHNIRAGKFVAEHPGLKFFFRSSGPANLFHGKLLKICRYQSIYGNLGHRKVDIFKEDLFTGEIRPLIHGIRVECALLKLSPVYMPTTWIQ